MSYQETLDYLFAQLPMFQRVGAAAFKKDLTNTLLLCNNLGNPQHQFPSIHIGGTNGKGSTAHATAAILQQSGYKTGLYISPHYRDFRERIKINGAYISEKEVIAFTEQNKALFERVRPSFFEMTVAMAFHHFAQHHVDVAVIEVGMGGRLDSTNVIHPLISVITNISYDHTQFLGDTLPLIAAEKAGIIKAHTPVVIGETHPETAPVFETIAHNLNAPLVFADKHFFVQSFQNRLQQGIVADIYKKQSPDMPQTIYMNDLKSDLSGNYQQKNLATILQTASLLPSVGLNAVNDTHIRQALAQVKPLTNFMGRWQVLSDTPLTIADSAHNTAGLTYAMNELMALPHKNLHLVIGMVADKDISNMLKLLPPNAHYYFCKADIPRGMAADILAAKAADAGLKGIVCSSVPEALRTAQSHAHPTQDIVYVGGSTFVVAEVI